MDRVAVLLVGLFGVAAAIGQQIRLRRSRATTLLLAEELVSTEDVLVMQNRTMLDLMRGNRDMARAVLLAHEQGLDITEDLRRLAEDLSDRLAQVEEHVA